MDNNNNPLTSSFQDPCLAPPAESDESDDQHEYVPEEATKRAMPEGRKQPIEDLFPDVVIEDRREDEPLLEYLSIDVPRLPKPKPEKVDVLKDKWRHRLVACDMCPKIVQKSYLPTHKRKQHPVGKVSKDKFFKCSQCEAILQDRIDKHLKGVHKLKVGTDPYKLARTNCTEIH